jgi:superoxide dismutase
VDNEIKNKQKDINNYKRTMDNEILSLHNDIETLKVRYDDRQRARVNNKNNEEQSNAEQSKKVQEISRVVMALDNLEKVFTN